MLLLSAVKYVAYRFVCDRLSLFGTPQHIVLDVRQRRLPSE